MAAVGIRVLVSPDLSLRIPLHTWQQFLKSLPPQLLSVFPLTTRTDACCCLMDSSRRVYQTWRTILLAMLTFAVFKDKLLLSKFIKQKSFWNHTGEKSQVKFICLSLDCSTEDGTLLELFSISATSFVIMNVTKRSLRI